MRFRCSEQARVRFGRDRERSAALWKENRTTWRAGRDRIWWGCLWCCPSRLRDGRATAGWWMRESWNKKNEKKKLVWLCRKGSDEESGCFELQSERSSLTIVEIDQADLQQTKEAAGQIEEDVANAPADGRFALVVVVSLQFEEKRN